MTQIVYQCTAYNGVNRVGQLKKDSTGYFEIVLGALNAYNAHGWYYSYEHAKALFENSSELMRRVNSTGLSRLRGECGHPRFQPGMTEVQWFARVNDIFEPNCCVHFKKIWLDFEGHKDDQGRPIILIMGLAKPSGANSNWLEKQFENPDEDVCFSIRSFTEDKILSGVRTKMLKKIVTWDTVNEPGIADACKARTPSLESLGLSMESQADLEMAFFPDQLRKSIEESPIALPGCSMESSSVQLLNLVAEIEKPIKIFVPASMRW